MNHAHIYGLLRNEKAAFLMCQGSIGFLAGTSLPKNLFLNVYSSNAQARKRYSIHANRLTLASNVPLPCRLIFDEMGYM
ncbi:MAG: hypothetical protein ACR2LC_07260 [Pyrinomonadaceae bacterium]